MTTKIRIDLSQGIVEAEGSEDLVRAIYGDFKERLQADAPAPVPPKREKRQLRSQTRLEERDSKGLKKPKRTKKGARKPKIASDLDLSGGKKGHSLRVFFAQYSPRSNLERNLIFVYYLQQRAEAGPITLDHVYTCYRDIKGIRVPGNLEQSLIDTRARKGWIDTSSLDDLKLTVPGINHIEHDMKKAGESGDA